MAMRPRLDLGESEDDGGGSGSRRRARMGEARAGLLAEMARDGRGAWRQLEPLRSDGGMVALGRWMKMMEAEKKMRRYIFRGSLVLGGTFSPG